jgi:hypothetical protein
VLAVDLNKIIARAKAILLTPKTEWPVIASEPATVADLYKNYIVVLAGIPAVFTFIKLSLIGITVPFGGMVRIGIASGISGMIVSYVLSLAMVYVMALIVDALAPSFDGQKNFVQALKTVAYAYTASWIAGIGQILPFLAVLIALAGGIYSIYLLYLGLSQTMKCPPEKAAGYTAVAIIVAIVLGVVVGMVVGGVTGVGSMMGGSGIATTHNESDVQFDKDSPLGKMQQWSKSVEQASKNMDAAQKSGDQNAQAAALKTMMGAALGGAGVEALPPDRLKPFIPETLAGMPRTEFSAERNNAMGMQISEARATFADEAGRSVRLQITDAGTAKGLLGLANWAGVEGEKQSDSGYEKTYRADGRLIHEAWHGDSGEYTVVVSDRFTVQVEGNAGSIDQLKEAVADLDLSGLEDLKDEGVKATR